MERRGISRLGADPDAEYRRPGVLGVAAGPVLRHADLHAVQERSDDRQASHSHRNAARGTLHRLLTI